MLLEGSCHCGAVRFSVESAMPYPFMACYCGICRKTAGTGGYAINLGADASTLRIEGDDSLSVYHAVLHDRDGPEERSTARRNFCSLCGTALWLYEPSHPELVHPHASAIDTPLPKPPEISRIMLASRAPWVEIPEGEAAANERHFDVYPDESLEQWHRRHGLYDG